jgi:MFS family permease
VIGMIAGMGASTALAKQLGRSLLHVGVVLIAAGTVTLALLLTGAHASTWDLVPGLFLIGTGFGACLGQLFQFILTSVNMQEVGSASGVMEASQQLSTALGVAVLGTIFFSTFAHHPATDALRITAWLCLVPLVAAFALVFRLPQHARTEEA